MKYSLDDIKSVSGVQLRERRPVKLGRFASEHGMRGTTFEQLAAYNHEGAAFGEPIRGVGWRYVPTVRCYGLDHGIFVQSIEQAREIGLTYRSLGEIQPADGQQLCEMAGRLIEIIIKEDPVLVELGNNNGNFRSVPKNNGDHTCDGPAHYQLNVVHEKNPIEETEKALEVESDAWGLIRDNQVGQRNAVRIANLIGTLDPSGRFLTTDRAQLFSSGTVRIPIAQDYGHVGELLKTDGIFRIQQRIRELEWSAFEEEQPPVPEVLRCGFQAWVHENIGQFADYLLVGTAVMGKSRESGVIKPFGGWQEMHGDPAMIMVPGNQLTDEDNRSYLENGQRRVSQLRQIIQSRANN